MRYLPLALSGTLLTVVFCTGQDRDAGGRLRVTHVGMAAPDIMEVTLRAGVLVYREAIPYEKQPGDRIQRDGHQRWVNRDGRIHGSLVGRDETLVYPFPRYAGDRLDGVWADDANSYRISSADDPAYRRPMVPAGVSRKTRPTDVERVGPRHAWQFDAPSESIVYLRLPAAPRSGSTYQVSFPGQRLEPVEFVYAPGALRSESIHISHLGFCPDDPVKVAFLSCWLGSGGPHTYESGLGFSVIDVNTGEAVLTGETTLSKAADDLTEDAYKSNYSGVDVFMMDFSALRREGTYRVSVEGVGCSFPFPIGDSVWRAAFTISARGFYHQRSGIELGPPFTTFERPRAFHPDDGVRIVASTTPLMNSGNGINYLGSDKGNFANLVAGKTDTVVPAAWGGYMDAGDWDRRIQHLIVSRYLLDLMDIAPETFGTLGLNIPESGNGLPDVVSEALFNLDCYRRMQTPEGGIRGGIESAEHPRVGEGSWQESLEVMAYAPGVWSSHWYAAVAAQAAWVLRDLQPALADVYRDSALRAMAYAEARWGDLGEPKVKADGIVDVRNIAAAELFRLTGDPQWNTLFLETTVFTDPGAALFKWPTANQRDNAWVYVRTDRPGVDTSVRANCRKAILREADNRARVTNRTGFGWAKYEWQPAGWGAFSAPDGVSLVRAHVLTGEERYLRALVLACQHGAGANPINLCYTTGLGHRWPRHPLHIDSRVTRQPPPPGLTVFGPMAIDKGKGEWGQKLADQVLFPAFEQWPALEAYWDIFWHPPMCEFTVQSPMARNAYVWGYLAAAER